MSRRNFYCLLLASLGILAFMAGLLSDTEDLTPTETERRPPSYAHHPPPIPKARTVPHRESGGAAAAAGFKGPSRGELHNTFDTSHLTFFLIRTSMSFR